MMRRLLLNSFLIAGMLVVALLANYLLFSGSEPNTDFYYNAWLPGRALMRGENPYEAPHFLRYPPWTLIFSLPFAWLPATLALASWALASECAAMGFLAAMARALKWQLTPAMFALVLVLIVLFRPSLATLLHGQYLFITLLSVSLAVLAQERGKPSVAGFCLALSLVKPQAVFLVVPAMLIWLLVRRHWSGAASFLLGTMALVALSEVVLPGWFEDWLPLITEQELQYRTNIVPSVWGLAYSLTPSHWVPVAVLVSLAVLAALAWLLWRYRRLEAYLPFMVSATIVATQIVTPKTWSYDNTMLLLPFLYCLRKVARPRQMGVLSTRAWLGTLVSWIAVLPYLLSYWAMRYHTEVPYALLPITLGALLLWLQALDLDARTRKEVALPDEVSS